MFQISGTGRAGRLMDVLIELAGTHDTDALARLVWLDTADTEPTPEELATFSGHLSAWWDTCRDSFTAYLAREASGAAIGVAWVSLAPRVPRPGALERFSGDIQTVYVVPAHRRQGIGSALVEAAARHAETRGAARVTVSSGRRALPIYERLGFSSSPRLLQRP
jgi:GNAT superfamily N-acetyltransferase